MTRLVSVRTWQPLAHLAQELRDERTERKAVGAEVKRLRQQGVPALEPADVPEDADYLVLRGLRDEDGRAVPCEQWPAVAGAAVVVEAQWFTAEDAEQTVTRVRTRTRTRARTVTRTTRRPRREALASWPRATGRR